MQRRHKNDVGTFLRKQILQVGSKRAERFGHGASAVGAACDGVVAHFLVKGNAGNHWRFHRFTQLRRRLDALEEDHARHREGKGDQESTAV